MRFAFAARWQAALVILLLLGSLAALFINSVTAFLLPEQEQRVRGQVAAAAARLADEAAPVLEDSWPARDDVPPGLQRKLCAFAEKVLANQPDQEGGFYLAGDLDQFTGAFPPQGPHHPPSPSPGREPPPPRPPGEREPPPPSGREPPPPPPRHDPPPHEMLYIRQQARDALNRDPGTPALVQALDVGPSRVVVATFPVGSSRPARAAVWVMVRLGGPEQLQVQVLRYQVSTGLALAGVLLSLVLATNLSRTVRAERVRREKLADDLRRSEHLASLGRLLAGVAHEVRNPLAGIRSTVQLWQRLPEQARTPSSLEAVLQAVDRLSALVGRLLYFARTGWDQPRPVDLHAVVRETLELVRAQAEAQGVQLETDLTAVLPPLAGSAAALQQVVLNLATNALQAMPKGGILSLRTRAADGPRRAELRVADTGPGVSPEARPHLFEPFYTTRPEGTGLGLALCREIVRQHGGDVDLEDAPHPHPPPQGGRGQNSAPSPLVGEDGGAVFRVWLPAGGEASTEKTP